MLFSTRRSKQSSLALTKIQRNVKCLLIEWSDLVWDEQEQTLFKDLRHLQDIDDILKRNLFLAKDLTAKIYLIRNDQIPPTPNKIMNMHVR